VNMMSRFRGRRALSQAISAVMLSAVVIAVGGAIWAYSQGAMIIIGDDYAESVIEMRETTSERFIIEQVSYNGTYLHVWIYNYGDVDIEVKIHVGRVTHSEEWIEITAGGFVALEPLSYLAESEELFIRAYTRRGNNVYYSYLVP